MAAPLKRGTRVKAAGAVVLVLTVPAVAAQEVKPTHEDVRYSKKYDRSVLDIWTVESGKPAPLVVMFHGGGFKMGDKSGYRKGPLIRKYHPRGVAFAAVNYPFMEHAGNVPAILRHTAEAIRFLAANARKYNIDSRRISVTGSSAGALISGYLGHGSKMQIRSVFAVQQPIGTPQIIVPILRRGGPPTIVYNSSGPSDKVHHPDNARAVHEKCRKVGIYSELYGSKESGLPPPPEGEEIMDIAMKLFYKTWKLPYPDEKKAGAKARAG